MKYIIIGLVFALVCVEINRTNIYNACVSIGKVDMSVVSKREIVCFPVP